MTASFTLDALGFLGFRDGGLPGEVGWVGDGSEGDRSELMSMVDRLPRKR